MYHFAEILRDANRDVQQRYEGSTWAAYTPFPFLYALAGQMTKTMQRKAPDIVKRAAVLTRDHLADLVVASQSKLKESQVFVMTQSQQVFCQVKHQVQVFPLPTALEPLRENVALPVLDTVESCAQFVTSEELPELYFVAKNRMHSHLLLRTFVLPAVGAMESFVQYMVIFPSQLVFVFPSREEVEFRTDLFLNVSSSRWQCFVEYLYSATEVLDEHWSMVQWNILGRGPYESLSLERRAEVIRSIAKRMNKIDSKYKMFEFMASVKLQNEMLYNDLLLKYPISGGVALTDDEIHANEPLVRQLDEHDQNSFPCWFYTKPGSPNDWIEFPSHENRRLERCYRAYCRQKRNPLTSSQNKVSNAVLVDEGRFEVSLDKMELYPVYWMALEKQFVCRSLWLYAERNYGLTPYDATNSSSLEEAFVYYLAHYEEEKQKVAKHLGEPVESVNFRTVSCSLCIPVRGHLVEIKSPTDIIQYKRLLAGGTTPFTSRRRVYRGDPRIKNDPALLEAWKQAVAMEPEQIREDDRDINDEFDHLVLIVHGIGEALKTIEVLPNVVQLRSIIDCAASLRQLHKEAAQSSHFEWLKETKRVEFLPIEWHTKLHPLSPTSSDATSTFAEDVAERPANSRLEEIMRSQNEGIQAVTLPAIPRLREFANDTVLDVLYFMSPSFHQVITEEVSREMNRIVDLFCERNKGWRAQDNHRRKKVSIIGHSLGSIICFDILCHQQKKLLENDSGPNSAPASLADMIRSTSYQLMDPTRSGIKPTSRHKKRAISDPQLAWNGESQYGHNADTQSTSDHNDVEMARVATPEVFTPNKLALLRKTELSSEATNSYLGLGQDQQATHYLPLSFEVENFFCFGSPIALFVSVRGQVIGRDFQMPTCPRLFNIYHPYDPVAYRMEPLINRALAHSKAEIIHTFEGKLRFQYQIRNMFRLLWQTLRKCKRDFECRVEKAARNIGLVEMSPAEMLAASATATTPAADANFLTSRTSLGHSTGRNSPPTLLSVSPRSGIVLGRGFSLVETDDGDQEEPKPDAPAAPAPAPASASRKKRYGALCDGNPIDYTLQENEIEITNEYLFALMAHTIYWTNRDASLFIAQQLLRPYKSQE